jgi:hypothetical protein
MQHFDVSDDIAEMERLNKELWDAVKAMDAQEAQYDNRDLVRLPQTRSSCDYQQAYIGLVAHTGEVRIQRPQPAAKEVQEPPSYTLCAKHRALERRAKRAATRENFEKLAYHPYTPPPISESLNTTWEYTGQHSEAQEDCGVHPSEVMPTPFEHLDVSPRKRGKRAARKAASPRKKAV